MCVKYDFKPKPGLKMDGQIQTVYPRKIGQVWFSGIVHIPLMKKLLLIVSTIQITMVLISIDSAGLKTAK